MRIKEVKQQVPEIDNRFIYYLEQQRYIQPKKERRGKKDLREYSKKDLEIIRKTWLYYKKEKLSPKAAYEKALKKIKTIFFFIKGFKAGSLRENIKHFKSMNGIVALYSLYEDADILLKVMGVDNEVQEIENMIGSSLLLIPERVRVRKFIVKKTEWEESSKRSEGNMLAWLLIRVPAKNSGGVVKRLKTIKEEGIRGAWTLYGEMDVLVKIDVESKAKLDDLIMNKIQNITPIEYTLTYLAVDSIPDMYWEA